MKYLLERSEVLRTDFINQAIKFKDGKRFFVILFERWEVDLDKVLSKNYQVFISSCNKPSFMPELTLTAHSWTNSLFAHLQFGQSVGQLYRVNLCGGLVKQLTFILSEIEDVLDLRVRRVFSSRKLLSSKLEPMPESEQEIQRDLLLQLTLVIILSDVQHSKHD